ncbi:MAG: regulatory iron-sulfur-containing complex subunit RicT [Bacteroidales bacterium]
MNKKYYINSNKFNTFNWLDDIPLPEGKELFDIVEVRFKNSRKDFFKNVNKINLVIGDVVAVEASPGHDIGTVSLIGELVRMKIKLSEIDEKSEEIKKIYRRARQIDIDKWNSVKELEVLTMYKAREIAKNLGLTMKICDVEYQGDGTKAIFYYTAEERVDFRELIKILADEFKLRIEMKQIGVRQESSKLGAIGSCGREVCCSTWLNEFKSVSTNAARVQQLSLNPQKLAGQCAKLKCCFNYEFDAYIDALQDFPDNSVILQSKKGDAVYQKTDVFKKMMWYSYKNDPNTLIEVNIERVKEVMAMNSKGQKPAQIELEKENDESNILWDNKNENQNFIIK